MSALKICPQCGAEYELDQRFCPKDGSTLKSQNAQGDLVGAIVADRYHVMRKLGEGGMGTVYLAEHVKMGRKSALKVMNPGMVNDADAISRFNREAANASHINHPNVAAVYDFGETSDGMIYLAMEFIEGPSLSKVIEELGALPPLRAADLTRQAAEALAVAHDMGIVHRDLKPDNIMIAKSRDGDDVVKVVDFGIAKAANNEAQKVTKTGMVVGTPEYMSPEQLAGDKLDGRSDTYSLALVAFAMLTGKLPFPAATVQESMIARLVEEPKTLAEMKPDTMWPPAVQAVFDKALQRDAAARFQSASEFGRELYRAVETMPEATSGTMVIPAPGEPPRTQVTPSSSPAVPPTRVNPVTPVSAPRAVPGKAAAPAKSRAPMFAGIAALVVVLGGAGAYVAMQRTGDSGALQQGDTAAVPLSQQVQTPVESPPPAVAPALLDSAALQIAFERIEPLTNVDRGANAETARRALGMLDSIDASARTDEDRVHLAILRVEANFVLERRDAGCAILQDHEGRASRTTYNRRVRTLLLAC